MIDNYVMKLSCHCEVKEFQNLETVYLTFCKKKQCNVSERSKLGHDNYNYRIYSNKRPTSNKRPPPPPPNQTQISGHPHPTLLSE